MGSTPSTPEDQKNSRNTQQQEGAYGNIQGRRSPGAANTENNSKARRNWNSKMGRKLNGNHAPKGRSLENSTNQNRRDNNAPPRKNAVTNRREEKDEGRSHAHYLESGLSSLSDTVPTSDLDAGDLETWEESPGDEDEDEDEDDEQDEEEELTGAEKIESLLRKNRIPETKVRPLAMKIWQQTLLQDGLRTRRYQKREKPVKGRTRGKDEGEAEVCGTLRHVITYSLDPLLYGKVRKTNLHNWRDNPAELVDKVSQMVDLLEVDMALCLDSIQDHVQKGSKSQPLLVRDAVLALRADHEILQVKHDELKKELAEASREQTAMQSRVDTLEESRAELEKDLKRSQEQNRAMSQYMQELKESRQQMKTSQLGLQEDNATLKKQVERSHEQQDLARKELRKAQEANAQLEARSAEKAKELRRLKVPDKDIVKKVRELQAELTEARTTNRKLEVEKGAVKANLQKLQAVHDSLQTERGRLVKHRQRLQAENEKMKMTNYSLRMSAS